MIGSTLSHYRVLEKLGGDSMDEISERLPLLWRAWRSPSGGA